MKLLHYCNKIIEYSFYALFLLVPLIFYGNTSELFELNKMWLTFGITIIVATAWIISMILQKRIEIQRTPLDIFILIFLVSQLLSTLFSLDMRVSLWGYYSRFNGGFLSTLSYVILYYAFVTHFTKEQTLRLLKITLVSGLLVVLWGLPSHFDRDPTCFIFRGTLDTSCWTDAFKPTIRMFSTLGQPAWLAAFIATILPIVTAFGIWHVTHGKKLFAIGYLIFANLLYLSLLYTNTRAGFIGFWVANIIFWLVVFVKKIVPIKTFVLVFLLFNFVLLIINFFVSTPIAQLNGLTYQKLISKQINTQPAIIKSPGEDYNPGITDSGNIRLFVWQGAIDAWKANPVLGTGVETFAFAYYKHRPAGHNMTSEWDYLYNKAHNEYLNYLTTSGILGLGTYLLFIASFIFVTLRSLLHGSMAQWLNKHNNRTIEQSKNQDTVFLTIGIFSGWTSILITNFFGFSVVIVNLFLFILPAFVFLLSQMLKRDKVWLIPKSENRANNSVTVSQWLGIIIVALIAVANIYGLTKFWLADQAYALGSNLIRAGEYQRGYLKLQEAISIEPNEPVFQDEFSYSSAQMSLLLYQNQQATPAAELAQQAADINERVLTNHPNNIVFWKTRIKIFYNLSQLDQRYLPFALKASEQAALLAPSDAKILYNVGVLQGQSGDVDKGIETLSKLIRIKPNYEDAYYALGLFYRQKALDDDGNVSDEVKQKKAEDLYNHVLKNINPNNEKIKETLAEWEES